MVQSPEKISKGVKPRVLVFSIAYEPLVGGAELAVRNITDRLFNYEFDLITCRFSRLHPAEEKIGNVRVFRVGFGSRLGRYLYPVLALRLATRLHRQSPYRLVWAIMAAYAGAAALLFVRRHPEVKFLLSLQEGDPPSHIHRRVRGFRRQWQRVFLQADYIQAISQYLADWAKREGATCPIEIVPNGVDLQKFSAQGGSASGGKMKSTKLKIEKNSVKVIITTSRLVPKNGIDILIKATRELKAMIPNSRFLIKILGGGPEEKKLKKLTRDLGLQKEVKFLGEVASEKVPEYLARADVFVRPSRSEGLGTALLEGMASGLPVIATPVGGIVDFLKDRQTGLFCKVDDAADLAKKILLLLQDELLRNQISENGWLLVEKKYTWERVAGQMEAVFKGLGS